MIARKGRPPLHPRPGAMAGAPPQMVFVKVCGIQTWEEAVAALDCGATALGFLVGLTHRAEDEIDTAAARGIVRRLPAGMEVVLVTHLLEPEQVAELAFAAGTRTIQVHGD